MITQQTPFLLRVLSGSNAGAIVRLKVGEVTLGRSMSSDIILHDESIADTHLQLKVSEDNIIMNVLAHPVSVDNEEVETDEILLKPFQVVTLGNVEFFIADLRKGKQKAGDNQVNDTQEPPVTGSVSLHSEKDKVAGSSGVMVDSSSSPVKKKSGGKLYLLLGLGALLIANSLYFLPNLIGLAETMGFKESPQARAESILDELEAEGITVERNADGSAVVSGYVDTLSEKRGIMTRMTRAGDQISYRIWANEELVTSAQQVAHALGQTEISFKGLGKGKLSAHGYVSSGEDWNQIKANIMEDISGIQSIEDENMQTLAKRKKVLEQFIDKKGLSSRIRVTIADKRIKVDGELTKIELNRWAALYQEFLEVYGAGPAIVDNLYDARDRIKLVIRSVSVGETPFLVAKDGNRYLEGSSLGNNYFIKKIAPDHVLLSNSGVEIPIYYGAEEK